jgi:hypothetical protein
VDINENGSEERPFHVDLALIHYPVTNKNNEIIGSAVTNLDIHDIARAGRTYGVDNFYIVTPYQDQQQLVRDILDHWLTGYGGKYNSDRKEALGIVRLCDDLETLYATVTEKWQQRPTILATCASKLPTAWTFAQARQKAWAGERLLLLFGTAWGLTPEAMNQVDGVLPPITGCSDYNHLSVRAAVAIVLDRLLGNI